MKISVLILTLVLTVVVVFAQQSPMYHTVQPKETFYAISKKYNVTVDQIKSWNHLSTNALSIGQKIIIGYKDGGSQPAATSNSSQQSGPIYHTMKPKETLYGLSKMYNVTIDQIKSWNRLSSNALSIGQRVIVGYGGEGTPPPATAPQSATTTNSQSKAIFHTVQPKETLYGLSVKYNTSVDQIKSWNNLTSNSLTIGQQLKVSAGGGAPSAVSTPSAAPIGMDDYTNAIYNGDKAYDSGDMALAKTWYMAGLSFNPGQSYPQERIEEIESFFRNQQFTKEQNEKYEEYLDQADDAFGEGNYLSANSFYEKANEIKPDEEYPLKMKTRVDSAMVGKKEYLIAIEKADNAYDQSKFELALQYYREAQYERPYDTYPEERIEIIEDILASSAKADSVAAASQVALDGGKEKKDKKIFTGNTWVFELSYLVVPSSFSNGGEVHFDFPIRPNKAKMIFPTIGFGGGVIYKNESNAPFSDFTTDVEVLRFHGAATFSTRFLLRRFNLVPRVGYNFTRTQYQYDNFSNCSSCTDEQKLNQHRIQYELIAHFPFGRIRSNYGFLVGVRFLQDFSDSDQNVIMIKTGFTF